MYKDHLPVFQSTVIHRSERSDPYINTYSTSSGVRTVVWIEFHYGQLFFAQLQWNDTMLKIAIHCSRVTCFPRIEVHGSKKTCHRVCLTSFWLISHSGKLCNENCIVTTTEALTIWSALCYTAETDKLGRNKRGTSHTAIKKRRWCLGYSVGTLHLYRLNDIYIQRLLWIIRELCTIIACLNSLVFSVECGFSELMQRIFEYGNIQNNRFAANRELNIYVERFLTSSILELWTFKYGAVFWPTLYLQFAQKKIRSYLSPSKLLDRQTTMNSSISATFEGAFLKNQTTTSKVHYCSNVRPSDDGQRSYIFLTCYFFPFYFYKP